MSEILTPVETLQKALLADPMDYAGWFALADALEDERSYTYEIDRTRRTGEYVRAGEVPMTKWGKKYVAAIKRDAKGRDLAIRSRKAKIVPATQVQIHDTFWSGGTINRYYECAISSLDTDRSTGAPLNRVCLDMITHIRNVAANCVLIEHSIFQGKDCGITIYVRPEDATRLT